MAISDVEFDLYKHILDVIGLKMTSAVKPASSREPPKMLILMGGERFVIDTTEGCSEYFMEMENR